jgi:hypothetical protein
VGDPAKGVTEKLPAPAGQAGGQVIDTLTHTADGVVPSR